ncbi:hypothetical protein BHE74_00044377 [Ensete ventricosum]|nr:hypothetical protein BHE74_00044377 [Ensete ventricosum]
MKNPWNDIISLLPTSIHVLDLCPRKTSCLRSMFPLVRRHPSCGLDAFTKFHPSCSASRFALS